MSHTSAVSSSEEDTSDASVESHLASLGLLAGGIAHDFNNILTAVIGNISLAKQSLADEEQGMHHLLRAEAAACRARDLTQHLLAATKQGQTTTTPISVGEIIRETVEFATLGSTVRVKLQLAPDLSKAEVDKTQFSQVIYNLSINSVQAMPAGGLLEVSAQNIVNDPSEENFHPSIGAGQFIRITHRDNGCGIDRRNRRKIFEPYFTTKENGSGLGLAISYAIIKKHRGHIFVDSGPGRGALFDIFLPAA